MIRGCCRPISADVAPCPFVMTYLRLSELFPLLCLGPIFQFLVPAIIGCLPPLILNSPAAPPIEWHPAAAEAWRCEGTPRRYGSWAEGRGHKRRGWAWVCEYCSARRISQLSAGCRKSKGGRESRVRRSRVPVKAVFTYRWASETSDSDGRRRLAVGVAGVKVLWVNRL